MENVTHAYFYFLIFFMAGLLFIALCLKLAAMLSAKLFKCHKEVVKNDGYAGGFYVLSAMTDRFPVRFVFFALLFVLFNASFLLLLPWTMSLHISEDQGLLTAVLVIFFLAVGYFYEYKKGALEWK